MPRGAAPRRRRVVVTGGASGIGRRTVVTLASGGHHVVLVARSHDRARPAVAEARARAAPGATVTVVPADLSRLDDVRAAIARCADHAPLDGLVNNAAVFDLSRRRPSITADGIEETFAVNHVAPTALAVGLGDAFTDDAVVVTAASKGLLALPWLRLRPDDLDSRTRYGPVVAYYRSKIAQLLCTAALGRRGRRAVALRIPSVRVDPARVARNPAALQVPYRAKRRLAHDPLTIARCYVALLAAPDQQTPRYVDHRGRDVAWTNDTGHRALAEWLWARTVALIDGVAGGGPLR